MLGRADQDRDPAAAASPVAATAEPDALDIAALLAAAAEDPEFAAAVAELMRTVAEKLPRDLRDEFAADDPQPSPRAWRSRAIYLSADALREDRAADSRALWTLRRSRS